MCGKKTCPFESNDNAVRQTYRDDCESILYPAVTHREFFFGEVPGICCTFEEIEVRNNSTDSFTLRLQ